jgi:hypothetical protein
MSAPDHTRCARVLALRRRLQGTNCRLGIETYNEGLDPIKSMMRWKKELPQCIRKLSIQHVHYAQTLHILFEPITSEAELAQMMTDPMSSHQLWKSKELDLQDRLQESYHAYRSTIENIERITKQIASRLELNRATEVSTLLAFLA